MKVNSLSACTGLKQMCLQLINAVVWYSLCELCFRQHSLTAMQQSAGHSTCFMDLTLVRDCLRVASANYVITAWVNAHRCNSLNYVEPGCLALPVSVMTALVLLSKYMQIAKMHVQPRRICSRPIPLHQSPHKI